jgi:diguanylate cyclase (GGDEF)-like protein
MLIAVDVDHLRHVNDTWSRATGDAVLQAIAGVLRAQSRPQDVLARADGSLFVVALGGPVSTTRALLVAERLRAAIEGHAWAGLRGGLRVTASIGVAPRAPGESLDDALARAGAALQECKRNGRNQVRSAA